MLLVETFAHRTDSTLLIFPVRDFILDAEVGNVGSSPSLNQQFQFFGGMDAQKWTPRITQAILHLGGIAVRYIDYRTHPIPCFQAIGIQLGLLLALLDTHTGPLGFHHGKRSAIGTEEYIVGISFLTVRRHSFHLHFDTSLQRYNGTFFIEHLPTGFLQHHVDEVTACFCFADACRSGFHRCIGYLLRVDACHKVFIHGRCLGRFDYQHPRTLHQFFIERWEIFDNLKFLQYRPCEVVQIEHRKEGFALGGDGRVCRLVAHLADVVYRHHQLVVAHKLPERLPIY